MHKSLHHPHIIQYLGISKLNDGDMYMVLEYASGGNLLELIRFKAKSEEMDQLAQIRM